MLKLFKSSRKVYNGVWKITIQRSFLSEAYRCEEEWNARLQSPLLQKMKPEELFIILTHKFATVKKVSALDIDIYANAILNPDHVQELLNLLHNLRDTAETTNTLDSTHHAVVRYLLNNNRTKELMDVLHDRLKYGIFPDHFSYNILMNTYIKQKDYASAAKVAVLPMLQEDCENPITNALSVYACHKYLENPGTWQPPEPVEDDKEEIKVRVAYLRNPFFDDHFDLTDPYDLVGKTLAFQGKFMNNILGRTCQLRGLILYKKYSEVSKLIRQWLTKVEENVVYNDVFNLIEKDNEGILETKTKDKFEQLLSEIEILKQKRQEDLCKDNLTEALENNVKCVVEKQQNIDIEEQKQKYVEWEKLRELKLNEQLKQLNQQTKLEHINKMKEELRIRERFLTYFENEEEIELEIEKKMQMEKDETERVLRMYHGRKKLDKLKAEEEYIPPKI